MKRSRARAKPPRSNCTRPHLAQPLTEQRLSTTAETNAPYLTLVQFGEADARRAAPPDGGEAAPRGAVPRGGVAQLAGPGSCPRGCAAPPGGGTPAAPGAAHSCCAWRRAEWCPTVGAVPVGRVLLAGSTRGYATRCAPPPPLGAPGNSSIFSEPFCSIERRAIAHSCPTNLMRATTLLSCKGAASASSAISLFASALH